MRFSEVTEKEKVARVLVEIDQDTPYEEAIVDAANELCNYGRAEWKYLTGYASGSTVWQSPDKEHNCTVSYHPTDGMEIRG